MRFYDILILGIETPNGQKIFSLLEKDYSFLSVAVPISNYPESIKYPQNQVKINYSNNIGSFVSSFKFIIAFDHKKYYEKLKIKNNFIDVSKFSFQMVIALLKDKIPISHDVKQIHLNIIASKSIIFNFLFYPKRDYMPIQMDNNYRVKIDEFKFPKQYFSFSIIFSNYFKSLIFFILSLIFKPFIYLLILFNCTPKIPFNKSSISDQSILLIWEDPENNDKKSNDTKNNNFQYYIYPNTDENEVICEYILHKINETLLEPPNDNSKFKSVCCSEVQSGKKKVRNVKIRCKIDV